MTIIKQTKNSREIRDDAQFAIAQQGQPPRWRDDLAEEAIIATGLALLALLTWFGLRWLQGSYGVDLYSVAAVVAGIIRLAQLCLTSYCLDVTTLGGASREALIFSGYMAVAMMVAYALGDLAAWGVVLPVALISGAMFTYRLTVLVRRYVELRAAKHEAEKSAYAAYRARADFSQAVNGSDPDDVTVLAPTQPAAKTLIDRPMIVNRERRSELPALPVNTMATELPELHGAIAEGPATSRPSDQEATPQPAPAPPIMRYFIETPRGLIDPRDVDRFARDSVVHGLAQRVWASPGNRLGGNQTGVDAREAWSRCISLFESLALIEKKNPTAKNSRYVMNYSSFDEVESYLKNLVPTLTNSSEF